MTSFIAYIVEASACMMLFYVVYYCFLRKLTFFRWNRFYLLTALMVSIIIPLLEMKIGQKESHSIGQIIPAWHIYESKGNTELPQSSSFNWQLLFNLCYFTGMAIVSMRFIVSLRIILRLYRSEPIFTWNGIRIVQGNKLINNCSFLDTVFINPGVLTKEEQDQVIRHEQSHIYLKHTHDKIFVALIQVLFWLNPFFYLYKKSLDEVHEFETDSLLATETDKKRYADLLLRIAVNKQFTLLHHFSGKPLKARVQMLFADRSRQFKKLTYFIVLPVLAFSIMSFSIAAFESKNGEEYKLTSQGPQTALQEEQSFISRTTVQNQDGSEVDKVEIRFGKNYLTGGLKKGGRLLYVINGENYEEDAVMKFSKEKIASLKCPCKMQMRTDDQDPLYFNKYDGIVEIKGKK